VRPRVLFSSSKYVSIVFFFLFVRGPGLGWADGFFAHRVPEGLIDLVLGLGEPFVALVDSPSERLG
jgi:hypothetical protein